MKSVLVALLVLSFSTASFAGEFTGTGRILDTKLLMQMGVLQQASLVRISQSQHLDKPHIEQTRWGDIVRYLDGNGTLEAWEIIDIKEVEGSIFFDYSRFQIGKRLYKGKPTFICTALVNNSMVYLGASENADRLKKAMLVVAVEKGNSNQNIEFDCKDTDTFFAQYPNSMMLNDIVVEILNSDNEKD